MSSIAHLASRLHLQYRSSRVARWAVQAAIAIIVPGGFVTLVLLWWLEWQKRRGRLAEAA
jgi:hypothetical protein